MMIEVVVAATHDSNANGVSGDDGGSDNDEWWW